MAAATLVAIAQIVSAANAAKPTRAAQEFEYTARLRSPVATDGPVAVGGITWNCRANVCETRGPWPQPGVNACAALARRLGVVESYGHPKASLAARQLDVCNAGAVNAAAALSSAKPILASRPSSKATLATPDLARKAELFNALRSDRERAVQTAQVQVNPAAGRAVASRVKGIDPASIRLSSKREMMGYTYRHGRGEDCDDTSRDVHPGASEICDNRDNNCDGAVDEGQKLLFFLDADGDGHGDPAQRMEACPADQRRSAESGQWLVPVGNDCDDSNPDRWHDCP